MKRSNGTQFGLPGEVLIAFQSSIRTKLPVYKISQCQAGVLILLVDKDGYKLLCSRKKAIENERTATSKQSPIPFVVSRLYAFENII